MTRASKICTQWVFSLGLAGLTLCGCSKTNPLTSAPPPPTLPVGDTGSDTWVATDALGRKLPGLAECGPAKQGKFVGAFYFLWLSGQGQLYDISRLLAENPENPKYGPWGAFHFWGQPHFGYYVSKDEFVIRKHAQMLTDAGVDVLIFDVTNAFTYDDEYLEICRIFSEIRKTGRSTPQIAFITHSSGGPTAQRVYDRFYAKNLYPDLWFRWLGKPLLLAAPADLTPALKEYFTVRESWAWTQGQQWFADGKDKWPWLDHTPQQPGWHDSTNKPEEIVVCVAEHPVSNIGRSFHNGKEPPPSELATDKGLYFAEQWKRALEVNPEFVFITGWNEWIAQRFENKGGISMLGRPLKKGETFFVDQYNQEYSRDVEPMKDGHGDNYYYQMVDGIRRFKGVRPPQAASAAKSIKINDDFAQWQDVRPEFRDDIGDTFHRNHAGWGANLRYTNNSGRNDFTLLKVSRDSKNLYFYARTREAITPPEGDTWMSLLLNTDNDTATGWEGCDFIVNMTRKGTSTAVVARNAGGWKWESVGAVQFVVKGNEIHMAIPRALVNLGPRKTSLSLSFKWIDNVPSDGNILEFIDQGDVAPNGRFFYSYRE